MFHCAGVGSGPGKGVLPAVGSARGGRGGFELAEAFGGPAVRALAMFPLDLADPCPLELEADPAYPKAGRRLLGPGDRRGQGGVLFRGPLDAGDALDHEGGLV